MSYYTRLDLRERCSIATFLSIGTKVKIMAERTGRHRSTIYREIKRNTVGERYLPGKAHELAKGLSKNNFSFLQELFSWINSVIPFSVKFVFRNIQ